MFALAASSELVPNLAKRTRLECLHAERGRSLFEGVLRNYPKRLDLWSVYLDQEIAAGEQQRIRSGGCGAGA